MEIALDEGGGSVGDYTAPFPFKGLIDEVRIYHRALAGAEIARHATARDAKTFDNKDLVLWYSFDAGNAADGSPRKNQGRAAGVTVATGQIGRALHFAGKAGPSLDFTVKHLWTKDIPVFARAMVLANKTLFVAGPPDVIDEEQVFKQIGDPSVQPSLARQAEALTGHKGASLIAFSASDATELARYELDSPPVFDGMAAANERLYMTTVDGSVRCFAPAQPGREQRAVATR
jgi:hypothetical protein